ncbi:1839_t:CDS:2 [Funneliformis geosporum]|nr:1839_t:CDS:2 [Funneliformis geosporum]
MGLTCVADGIKFPPICIFKGKQLPKGEWISSGNIKMVDRSKTPMLMVYDSFREYLKESVKQKFRDNRFDLAVISGGLTNLCQPFDVAINKPFKNNLHKEWHLWMTADNAGQTAADNL